MTKTEILELISNGEDSGVEFKRDDVRNHDLAKELVAFLNLQGGAVLLGVEDDGTVFGTNRKNLEEWVAELCRRKIDPPIIPYLDWVRNLEPGKDVLVARVPIGPDKPYGRVHNDRRTYFVRVGSTSREASREELERMFQAAGRVQYGLKPVPGTTLDHLDMRRLEDYFGRVLGGEAPQWENVAVWERLLCNTELMVDADGVVACTVDGMLLFGKSVKRFLPQSGIRAIRYEGTTVDYATKADEDLKGPLVPLQSLRDKELVTVETSLVQQALDFVSKNTTHTASVDDAGQRIDRPAYPHDVLREALVNSLVHRDYSISGADVSLSIFDDRIELISPGRLPNTATVDALLVGFRYARNQTLVNVMRDYRFVDFRGMGIRNKIIPGMKAHNGTEPKLDAGDHNFSVTLWGTA